MLSTDELGRATSTIEGVGIAWAAAEALLRRDVYTLFCTHMRTLTSLAACYEKCENVQMQVEVSRGHEFRCLYTASRGGSGCSVPHYGIQMCQNSGFPEQVVSKALQLSQRLGRQASTLKREYESQGSGKENHNDNRGEESGFAADRRHHGT